MATWRHLTCYMGPSSAFWVGSPALRASCSRLLCRSAHARLQALLPRQCGPHRPGRRAERRRRRGGRGRGRKPPRPAPHGAVEPRPPGARTARPERRDGLTARPARAMARLMAAHIPVAIRPLTAAVLATVALATAAPAAEPAPAWAKPYIGAWTLSGADVGGFVCGGGGRPGPGGGGGRGRGAPAGREGGPVEDAAAFTEGRNHDLMLIDPLRHPGLRFRPAGDSWTAARPKLDGDDIVLIHVDPADTSHDAVTWSLSGPDTAPACG